MVVWRGRHCVGEPDARRHDGDRCRTRTHTHARRTHAQELSSILSRCGREAIDCSPVVVDTSAPPLHPQSTLKYTKTSLTCTFALNHGPQHLARRPARPLVTYDRLGMETISAIGLARRGRRGQFRGRITIYNGCSHPAATIID
ncbi:hypothetical protein J6590_051656 [Homalodisca vitripennis]|nr:hypothetical protein J6590_051656 [Homalodisca vitripennis]